MPTETVSRPFTDDERLKVPKLMRPTVPIAQWRIAVDLEATRDIQNQAGMPAFGCECKWCKNWARVRSSVLPIELQEQLRRLCVDASHPTDLYAFEEVAEGAHCRVTYHLVGKILSGPNAWSEDPRLGRVLVYHMLREAPALGLVVVPSRLTFGATPSFQASGGSELLTVDLRLFVPLSDAGQGTLANEASP